MNMEIIFLGTSEATPTVKRGQTAIFFKYKNENILLDCGEGTQRQMKIAKISPCSITRIFISHWHGDHVLGLPGLIQTLALNNYNKVLKIYGPGGTKKFVRLLLNTFVYKEKIKAEIHEITRDGKVLDCKDFYMEAFNMKHFTPCLAYRFVEKEKRRIKPAYVRKIPGVLLGKLQQGKNIMFKGKRITAKQATYLVKGRKIAFIMDTLLNKNCFKAARDANLVISEATFLESEHLERAKERGHLTAKQAGTIAKKAKAKQLVILHLSQRYSKKRKEQKVLQEARKTFKNTKLADDFMRIRI
jgi:ribonuclease Z